MGKIYSSKIKIFGLFAIVLSILFSFRPSGLQAQNKVTEISVDAAQTGTLTYGISSYVTYNVTIKSDGAATAGSTTLSLNWGTTPAGVSFSPATVTIPAGNTITTATLTVTSAVNTAAGSYSFTVTSTDSYGSITSSSSSSFVVDKATLNVTARASDKVYDGNTTAAITLSSYKLSGDVVTINYAAANFNTAAVGTNKPVTVTGISISGTDASNYTLASTTASATANITKAVTSISVVSNNNSSCFGSSTTFTATISSSPSPATGQVQFFDAATLLATSAVSGNTATYTTTSLTVGSHSITVKYLGDDNFSSSPVSPGLSQTVNAIPTIATVTPASRCGIGSVILGAVPSTGIINWYANSTGGISLGTGSSFTTPNISSTTTYYVDATANGCTTGTRTPVTATVNTLPAITASSNSVVCQGNTLNLFGNITAGAIGSPSYSWTGPNGFNSSLQNPSIVNAGTNASGTYSLTVTNGNGCIASQTTNVIVNPVPNVSIDPVFSSGFVKKFTNSIVIYTYTITNIGSVPDSYNLSYIPDSDPIDVTMDVRFLNIGGTPITATPIIPAGGTYTFQLELSVQGNQPRVYNHTIITATSNLCSNSSVSADAYTYEYNGNKPPSSSGAQLEIAKQAIDATTEVPITTATIGVPFKYQITLVNNSTSAEANNVVISDKVPLSLTITDNNGGSQSGNTITWNVGTLTKTGKGINTVVKTITVIPTCSSLPSVSNTVNVISSPPDNGNGIHSATVSVTVTDPIPPTVICKPATVSIDATGIATVTSSMINNGSYDNCGIDHFTVSPSTFNCSQLGQQSVTLTAFDKYGNSSSCITTVTVTLGNAVKGTWLGKVNTNWSDCANWSGGVIPDLTTNVSIPVVVSGFYPIIDATSGNGYAHNITLALGTTLTVSGQTTLQIAGNVTNNGVFNAILGKLEFNGSLAQSVSGSSNIPVQDLIISNSNLSGVTLNEPVDVYESVTFGTNGTSLNTGSGGFLTLKSTADKTAYLGNMTGHTLSGEVTVERYINIGDSTAQHKKAWLFIAPNTHGQTIKESWMENGNNTIENYGINITGPEGTGGGWDSSSPAPAIKYYVPATGQGTWKGASGSGVALDSQPAWMVFVRGDRRSTSLSSPAYNTTLRSKGTVNIGPSSITVPGIADGFYALGNPYPSSVEVNQIGGIGSTYYVWNPGLTGEYGLGKYETYADDGNGNYILTPGVGSDTGNFINSGQAFFVPTDSNSYTLTFTENSKVASSKNQGFFRGSKGTFDKAAVLRSNIYASDSSLVDGTLQMFSPEYSDLIDRSDARKMLNSGINLSLKVDNKLLVVERRQPITQADTIYFNLTGTANGKYSFGFDAKNFADPGLNAWLEDAFTKGRTPVNMNGITNISFDVTSAATSKAANRFKIVFATAEKVALPVTFVKVEAVNEGPQVNVKWKVANEINLSKYVVMKSTDGNNFTDLTDVPANGGTDYFALDKNPVSGYNYYRIRSVDRDGAQAYSEIAKVWMGNNKPLLSVFPNPVVNGIVNLRFENMPSGKYLIRLLNPSGQVILNNSLNFAGGNYNEKIPWNYQMAHGSYQLEITRPDGSVKTIIVMY
ncbi:MAG: Ig-like domain repeat protein [Chitinophagaceae bacterium]|nr:Ig-like domain repeat protein [Chitinophagaceae bacterium]